MIHYQIRKDEGRLWLEETTYDPKYELKTESVFSQSNGKIGIRGVHDFKVLGENRGMFIGGLYQKAYESEVTELVNCPDLTEIVLNVQGEIFSLDRCVIHEYKRSLDLKTGELVIKYHCKLKNGLEILIRSQRFVSYADNEFICQKLVITPLNKSIEELTLKTGINGQITNSGVSHFQQIDCRVYDKKYIEMKGYLKEDTIQLMCGCMVSGENFDGDLDFVLSRRKISGIYKGGIKQKQSLCFTKYMFVRNEIIDLPLSNKLASYMDESYEDHFRSHCRKMADYLKYANIHIDGATLEEEAAVCFSIYHLLGMTPKHTSEYSVGAKGLTGEGYKGHVFWDVELFIQPFFLHVFPKVCQNLLIYRYKGLDGARAKAKDYGYKGAMFPWESAKDGYEETPLYAALNIHTGKADKVWSGIKEHHVTADIVYAVWQYYSFTGDRKFMDDYGLQIVFESADFWVSRAIYNSERNRYEILDIIGPDEYTEHIDNNAYTNYMAWFAVNLAVDLYEDVSFTCSKNLCDEQVIVKWKRFLELLYLPLPNENMIVPQDDTFLSKPELPHIDKYKNAPVRQSILLDYSRKEVVDMQVLKQADTVMLLNLFPDLFEPEIVKKNVLFYERRTIHDSSLSYCAHAQACASIGEMDLAWRFFEKAMVIDLDERPKNSADGIHSASLGGIWNCIIYGFAGLSHEGGKLKISPNLPAHWKKIEFYLNLRGNNVFVCIDRKRVKFVCEEEIRNICIVNVNGKEYELKRELCVEF